MCSFMSIINSKSRRLRMRGLTRFPTSRPNSKATGSKSCILPSRTRLLWKNRRTRLISAPNSILEMRTCSTASIFSSSCVRMPPRLSKTRQKPESTPSITASSRDRTSLNWQKNIRRTQGRHATEARCRDSEKDR